MKLMLGGIGAAALACGLIYTVPDRDTLRTFRPFCINDLTYRLNVTIEAAGKQYSSGVVSQTSHSLGWLALIHGGCQQTHGTALSFRLADNRVVLMSSYICPKARQAFKDALYKDEYAQELKWQRKMDLTSLCIGMYRDQPPSIVSFYGRDAFVIDDADNPTRWRGFNFDRALTNAAERIRIVSAVAEAVGNSPRDQLDEVAPAILKTTFKYDGDWGGSPEVILSFSRRYGPNKHFTYTAERERPSTP
jgi:hypothetical protein